MRILTFLVLFLTFVKCSNKSESERIADKSYENFKNIISNDPLNQMAEADAKLVADHHYDSSKRREAFEWLYRYEHQFDEYKKKESAEKSADSLRFAKIGGLTELAVETQKKCNLTSGYYMLNKIVTDSSDLAFLAKHMANYLFQNRKKDPGCSYPVMSLAFIMMKKKDYSNGNADWVSTCSITPMNYSGNVSVNELKIEEYKK